MKRVLALSLAVIMATGFMAGCSKENVKEGSTNTTATATATPTPETTEGTVAPDPEKKLEKWPEKVTLTWYVRGNEDEYYQHLWEDMEAIKAIEEATNITIEFQVATNGDSYIPMMTSGEYPDIITANNLSQYPGRLSALYKDGISTRVDDLIDEYMPNYKKILEENPAIAKDLKIDSGEYTFFSQLYDTTNDADRKAKSSFGIAIRKDWLDAVGKEIPTNMDEWYDVLKAFKTQDPNGNGIQDEEPICFASSAWKYFVSAYGFAKDPSIDPEGKVIYGFATDTYKQYLETMNKWYNEGLIYNFFEKTAMEDLEERVTNNLAGAWKADAQNFNATNSFLSKLQEKVPTAEFVAVPWPKATADSVQYGYADIASFSTDTTVITSNCKNKEAAAFLMDYFYSEEGSSLITWGVEGKSYDVVDGKKVLKPEMADEMDYYNSKVPTMYKYADSSIVKFPSFGKYSDFLLSTKSEGFINACTVWSQGEELKMPYPVQLSPEQDLAAETATEGMDGYINDMRNKFITGEEPLTNFDAYMDQLELMGLNTLLEVWQECYDAYLAR